MLKYKYKPHLKESCVHEADLDDFEMLYGLRMVKSKKRYKQFK